MEHVSHDQTIEAQRQQLQVLNEQLKVQNELLQIRNEQLMCILDSISDGITIVDKEGRGILINAEARRIFGGVKDVRQLGDSMRKSRFTDLSGNPMDRQRIPGVQALQGKKVSNIRVILENEKGKKIIETSATPILGRNNEVMMVASSFHDITDQIRLETELKESELKYQNLFNSMESAYVCYKAITDGMGQTIDYEVVDINIAYETITGLSKSTVLGKRAMELFPGAFRTNFEWRMVFPQIAFEGKSVSCDLFSENSGRWYHINCFCPKNGYIVQVFNDVTAQFCQEQKIEEMRERLLQAQELALMGEWEYDIETCKASCSDELFRIHGYEPQSFQLTKDRILETMYPVQQKLFKMEENMKGHCVSELQEYEYQYVGHNKTGWASVRSKGIYNEEGKLVRIRGYLQDITKQKLLEQEAIKAKEFAEEASYQKSEYIASMSHELRTPLNVMLGAVQLFELYLSGDLDSNREKMQKHMNGMKQNCLRMVRLVNNLIDSTKIDAGFLQLQLSNYDMVQVIGEIANSIVTFAAQKNIKVIYEPEVISIVTQFDLDSMERIMLNLLSNAIKFTEEGGTIRVKVSQREDIVMISVRDNGIGIPGDKTNMIFERYHQVDRSLARMQEGSGIGLSLAKSLVEMHGGQISVRSELGLGSEFVIELPAITATTTATTNIVNTTANSFRLSERMNIEFADIYL